MNSKRLSTTHIILLSFLTVIALGTALLALPISAAHGVAVAPIDALFTAVSATCVTGLVTLTTATTWSFFGQAVILVLIQVGGLGVVTMMAGLMLVFQRRMGLGHRALLQDAFNLNSLSGLIRFLRRALLGTFAVEGAGALLYMTVLVPRYGLRGVWMSVFNAVSAFCNAGMDVISENSLCDFAVHPVINGVTCALIILGGIGFIVWWDLLQVLRQYRKLGLRQCWRRLTLHSRITLWMTVLLLAAGTAGFALLEWNNPLTLGDMTGAQKLQAAFFQSVTCRTAGFATVSQSGLTQASALLALVLMFIGGSPVGTAGGIKTVTLAVIGAAALSTVRNRSQTVLFDRALSTQTVRKAFAVFCTSFLILILSTLSLAAVTHAPALDILYETVSATGTVGLSRDLTPLLNLPGKLIVAATMYLGRVGPISLAIAFGTRREAPNAVRYPTEEISVG